jgi:hypothetical protein
MVCNAWGKKSHAICFISGKQGAEGEGEIMIGIGL